MEWNDKDCLRLRVYEYCDKNLNVAVHDWMNMDTQIIATVAWNENINDILPESEEWELGHWVHPPYFSRRVVPLHPETHTGSLGNYHHNF